MREAVLATAVDGRLVAQYPTDPPAAKLLADIGVEILEGPTLGVLPAGWAWASISALAADTRHSVAIGPFGSNLKVADYRRCGVPLVFVRNIRRRDFESDRTFITPEKAIELRAHTVRDGDVLITKMGDPPGDTAVYRSKDEAVITADCIKFTPGPCVTAEYLAIAISAGETRRQLIGLTSGVAQQKITLGGFKRLPVPVPPLAEQIRIVAQASLQSSLIEACERAVEAGLLRSAVLRRSVLKTAFEGRLVSQADSDEPASMLLDRIRAAREVSGPSKGGRQGTRKGDAV
jgi:type I restriction enzyme S subunit